MGGDQDPGISAGSDMNTTMVYLEANNTDPDLSGALDAGN